MSKRVNELQIAFFDEKNTNMVDSGSTFVRKLEKLSLFFDFQEVSV
jgi:hypothetical protein